MNEKTKLENRPLSANILKFCRIGSDVKQTSVKRNKSAENSFVVGSTTPSITGTSSLRTPRIKTRREKEEHLKDEILLAENSSWYNAMMEHYYTEDVTLGLKGLTLELEKEKKVYSEQVEKIKAIKTTLERHDNQSKIAHKLIDLPSNVPDEVFVKSEVIRNEVQKIRSPILLKNFNRISVSDSEEIVDSLKKLEHGMDVIKKVVEPVEMNRSDYLPEIVEEMNMLKNTVEKCKSKEDEFNDLLAKCISLKIGLEKNQSSSSQ